MHPHAPLLLTGHSLGAAVAAITAVDLHVTRNLTAQRLLTFGEPRVGNAAFVAQLLQVVPHPFRVTHWRDVVPNLPLEMQGYVHAPQEVWYSANSDAFKLCDPHDGEDPTCNKQFWMTGNPLDHIVYLNLTMSHTQC
ncbi:Aste57867_6046 [Aphanomyces stellatus]|nr:hypothetical protein As57867_006032 [Aphanomyces stellatus]VFT83059.1 Aste57867_6046 [Aphanomyces stellatus]